MCTFLVYPMAHIVKDNLYLSELDLSMSPDDVDEAILRWRDEQQKVKNKQ